LALAAVFGFETALATAAFGAAYTAG